MKISVAHTPPTTIPYGKTCIVIDVLRATSVIAVLLDLGVKEIYPTATIEEARSLKQFLKTSNEQVLLLGERDGLPPEGFDHGNSPTALIDNPSVPLIAVQATTHGTPALLSCHGASSVIAAAPLNLSTACKHAADSGNDILIVCAGLRGQYAEDDMLAAGMFVEKLVSLGATSTDTATEALILYKKSERFFAESLRQTEHGQKTFELGFNSDIEKCAEIDKYKVFGVLSTNHNRPCIIPNQVRH